MSQDPFAGTAWRKSTRSNNECVEIAITDQVVGVRDGKDPHGPILTFTPAEWKAFIDGAQHGEFDL